ncbi:Bro-N domain-containing protein [Aliiroseovarius crassostreae]|uniref:BRO-N domain-containing protein n=1 Tax=Aliiroseovarius crassostreae TaxID=154981 RepID=UPI00220641A4|nr:Bro-N domain-containing protein [Aliiroseovarius crassostreae]UWQ05928.1 Bro-N domain-containing protein [Aliiroseovarius crassostreae]
MNTPSGEPWFVAADVCKALDVGNARQAVSRLDEDKKMTVTSNDGQKSGRGGAQFNSIINESGLYSMILSSRKPEAMLWKRWELPPLIV